MVNEQGAQGLPIWIFHDAFLVLLLGKLISSLLWHHYSQPFLSQFMNILWFKNHNRVCSFDSCRLQLCFYNLSKLLVVVMLFFLSSPYNPWIFGIGVRSHKPRDFGPIHQLSLGIQFVQLQICIIMHLISIRFSIKKCFPCNWSCHFLYDLPWDKRHDIQITVE